MELGELILKQDTLILTVRREAELEVMESIAWDINTLTMDGFDGGDNYTVSLEKIYTIHRAYMLKRKKI